MVKQGYEPVEVAVQGTNINRVVLSDQVKSLDWKARRIVFIDTT